jgi:hypothetical protein
MAGSRRRVVNVDDPFGQSLAEAARGRRQKVLTYGLVNADIVATAIANTRTDIRISIATPWEARRDRKSRGRSARRTFGVLGVLLESGIALDDALAALAHITAPPGRMQRLGGGFEPLVVIDYAHSPDALEKVLTALRPAVVEGGELICVFGCGGDRDAGKRPDMGRIAARLADRIVVTSDNPRGEDPAAIAEAVVRGIREAGSVRWSLELDRGAAIREAIAAARGGDVVLVAGKGHEDYQETKACAIFHAAAATAALAGWTGADGSRCRARGERPHAWRQRGFTRVVMDIRTPSPATFRRDQGRALDGHDSLAPRSARAAAAPSRGSRRKAGEPNVAEEPSWRYRLPRTGAPGFDPDRRHVGSNGKTMVKEMLAAILRTHYGESRVCDAASNNAIGLPLTLLRPGAEHVVAAIEWDESPGETAGSRRRATHRRAGQQRSASTRVHVSVADVAIEHAALVRG